jgi:hypothetical protein
MSGLATLFVLTSVIALVDALRRAGRNGRRQIDTKAFGSS